MNNNIAILLLLALVCAAVSAAEKPRVFVLTDIENEPDDAMSMVRFLTYANHFDVEGLAATTSVHQQKRVVPQRIRRIVGAYGKVRDNLEKHEQGYPTADFLLAPLPYRSRLINDGSRVGGMYVFRHAPEDPMAFNRDDYSILVSGAEADILWIDGPYRHPTEHWTNDVPAHLQGTEVIGVPRRQPG